MKTKENYCTDTKRMKRRKDLGLAYWHYSAEDEYNAARERLEAWEAVERERYLEDWEEDEKKADLWDLEYYGRILEEEEEQDRQHICESQGLSRWC